MRDEDHELVLWLVGDDVMCHILGMLDTCSVWACVCVGVRVCVEVCVYACVCLLCVCVCVCNHGWWIRGPQSIATYTDLELLNFRHSTIHL